MAVYLIYDGRPVPIVWIIIILLLAVVCLKALIRSLF